MLLQVFLQKKSKTTTAGTPRKKGTMETARDTQPTSLQLPHPQAGRVKKWVAPPISIENLPCQTLDFGLRACRAVNECFPVVSVTLSGTTCCCKPRKLINVATIFSLSHPSSKYTFDFVLVASESLQQEGLGHFSRCDSHLHSPFPFQVFQFPP